MKKLTAVFVLLVALSGCAAFFKGVRTVADVARCLCEIVAAEQVEADAAALGGLTPEQWCEVEENARPFVDSVVAARQSASREVGFARE